VPNHQISKVPFLVKGLLDWMAEANLTPYLIVNTRVEGVSVPEAFAQPDGTITLNIGGDAVRGFQLESEGIYFSSRFQGNAYSIVVPTAAILGLVSRETTEGLWFSEHVTPSSGEQDDLSEPEKSGARSSDDIPGKPKLSLVTPIKKD